MMRRILKIPMTLLAVAAVAIAAALGWWHTRNVSLVSYTTATVVSGEVVATISATGTIEPMESVVVGAQVAGRMIAFGTGVDGKTIDYGSTVKKGAVLAKIDDSVYAADLATAKAGQLSADANLQQMKAKLDLADAQWKQAKALYESTPPTAGANRL